MPETARKFMKWTWKWWKKRELWVSSREIGCQLPNILAHKLNICPIQLWSWYLARYSNWFVFPLALPNRTCRSETADAIFRKYKSGVNFSLHWSA
jgi:hypothetical protein